MRLTNQFFIIKSPLSSCQLTIINLMNRGACSSKSAPENLLQIVIKRLGSGVVLYNNKQYDGTDDIFSM